MYISTASSVEFIKSKVKMTPEKFKQKQPECEAMQYNGYNAQDMVIWQPDYLEIVNGVLRVIRNPFPVEVSEWVYVMTTGVGRGQPARMTNDSFILTWGK